MTKKTVVTIDVKVDATALAETLRVVKEMLFPPVGNVIITIGHPVDKPIKET